MALSKLGSGDETGMQLLAGFAGNDLDGGKSGSGGRGLASLAVERIARIALSIIATGSASLLTPGDISGIGGGGRGEGTGGGAA